jgi:hypothetical protein
VACSSRGSPKLKKFESEIFIHFTEVKDVDKRPGMAFSELLVRLSCGRVEFVVPENELRKLN